MTPSDRLVWDQAGMGVGDGGGLERPLGNSQWALPEEFFIDGADLAWRWESHTTREAAPSRRPGPGLLEGFVRLADGSAEDVVAYASRWGPLTLCQCGRPFEHRPTDGTFKSRLGPCDGPEAGDPYGGDHHEPLDAWFRYARKARAILRLAAAAHRSQQNQGAWEELLKAGDGDVSIEMLLHYRDDHISSCGRSVRTVEHGACSEPEHEECECGVLACYHPELSPFVLGEVIDRWLEDCNVRARFVWFDPGVPEINVGPFEGLVGAIGLQLALAAGRADAFAFCSSCLNPYVPTRRPSASRRNYCFDCRDRGRWRDAQRSKRTDPGS